MQNLSIEIKGLVVAIVTVAVLFALLFGISALVTKPEANSHAVHAPSAGSPQGTAQSEQELARSGQLVAAHAAFMKSCASCHGANAQGMIGPSLLYLDVDDAHAAAIIKNGVSGKMPAFGSQYSDREISGIAAYLRSIQKPRDKAAPRTPPSGDSSSEGRF